jgi:predicted nucleotide-binding protein
VLGPLQQTRGFEQTAALHVSRRETEKWLKFTIDLLKGLFSDFSIQKEFGGPDVILLSRDPATELLRIIDNRIHSLDSILQRLPLFQSFQPVSVKPILPGLAASTDVFIVHGHDNAVKEEVARFVEKLGLRAIILHEQSDKGRTIIEKFEAHANVGFAVILLTPDDIGHPKDRPAEATPRARQNVLFELGFFIGSLGRARVCVLRKGDIETPTDHSGVLYKTMETNGGWKFELAREIKQAGIDIDLNRVT